MAKGAAAETQLRFYFAVIIRKMRKFSRLKIIGLCGTNGLTMRLAGLLLLRFLAILDIDSKSGELAAGREAPCCLPNASSVNAIAFNGAYTI